MFLPTIRGSQTTCAIESMKLKQTSIILGLIVLMFIADGINSILRNLGTPFFTVSVFVRFVAQGYFLFLILHSKRGIKVWLLALFLMVSFGIGFLAGRADLYVSGEYHLFDNFKDINKLLFFFVCFEVYCLYFNTEDKQQSLFRVVELLFLVQTLVIIMSFIFDIRLFAAYYRPERGVWRFGYQGLIPAQNEVSAFFLIAFFYFLAKMVYLKRGLVPLLLVTTGAILTGTKVGLIPAGVLLFYACRWVIRFRVPKAHLMVVGLIIIVAGLALVQFDYIMARIQPTLAYFTYQQQHGFGDSLIGMVTTGRDYKLQVFLRDYLPRFNLLNYLFGGYDRTFYSIEFDVIDVFAMLGLVGGGVFYYYYLKKLLYPLRGIDSHRLIFIIVWLGVSVSAGHIVFSAINNNYLPVLIMAFFFFKQKGYYLKQSNEDIVCSFTYPVEQSPVSL
jgi:hypothetical protein